jgi:hypothetical protein
VAFVVERYWESSVAPCRDSLTPPRLEPLEGRVDYIKHRLRRACDFGELPEQERLRRGKIRTLGQVREETSQFPIGKYAIPCHLTHHRRSSHGVREYSSGSPT